MSPILTSSLLVLALGALGATGPACGGVPPPENLAGPDESRIDVHIISHNFRDAVISLYVGSSRQRMGLAGGNQTTMFTIPWRRVAGQASVRLRAELIGSQEEVLSETLQLRPDSRVVWTLENHIDSSTLTVY